MSAYHIGIVGAGNVGSHLIRAFEKAGHRISVYSRSEKTDSNNHVDSIEKLKACDFIFIATNDNQIQEIATALKDCNSTVMHLSGTMPLSVLTESGVSNCGVFYPLQSFKKDRDLDYKKIPLLIEANSSEALEGIMNLANQFSDQVMVMSSEQRKELHLAAVMVNNFTNFLYIKAEDYLSQHNIDRSLLWPLIEETGKRIQESNAINWQTGPAKRADNQTIEEHLIMLENDIELKELYAMFSDVITKKFNS